MTTIRNLTPHDVTVGRDGDKQTTFHKEGLELRLQQDEGHILDDVTPGVAVQTVGRYWLRDEDVIALNFGWNDVLIVSSLLAPVLKEWCVGLCMSNVRIVVPASGPGQCYRDDQGRITGVKYFLEY